MSRARTGVGTLCSLFASGVLLTSCTTVDLSNACLPVKAPAEVRLARDVSAYSSGKADIELRERPHEELDPILRAGTALRIERITQTLTIDVPNPDIDVFGRLKDGRSFYYHWGNGQDLDRAPWEPETTPEWRVATCAHK